MLFLCPNSYKEDALYPIGTGGEASEDPPSRKACNFKFNQAMNFKFGDISIKLKTIWYDTLLFKDLDVCMAALSSHAFQI